MRSTYAVLSALLLAAGLAGCGGGGDSDASTDLDADARQAAGCPTATEDETEELYVRSLFDCAGNQLYVFNTSSARDSWAKIANEFGAVELKRGKTWLLVKP